MLGVIELQRVSGQPGLSLKTTICPGNCRQNEGIFYLGYWEQIRPYVANSGQHRNVGSVASLDRLIRLEIKAHPAPDELTGTWSEGDKSGTLRMIRAKERRVVK